MTGTEHLKGKLNQMALMFPFGRFAYELDKYSGMHIIQVWPLELYDFDNKYKEIETKISLDFDNGFYPESVLFVSEDSLNQVSNPEFEILGLFYGLQPMINKVVIPKFISLNQEPFESGENNYALAA